MTTPSSDYKRQTTERLIRALFFLGVAAFIIVLGAVVLGFLVPVCFSGSEKILAAKLIYSANGMLIGFFEIVLGMLVALIGLNVAYEMDASAGPAKLKLVSTSPGLLLILCGNLLLGFSLMREFHYREIELGPPQPGHTAEQGRSKVSPEGWSTDIPPSKSEGPK